MIRRPPRSTRKESSAASDVYKRQDNNLQYLINNVSGVLLAEVDPTAQSAVNLTNANLQQRRVILGNMSGACQGLTRLNEEQPTAGFTNNGVTTACERISSMNTEASRTTSYERTQQIERRGYRLTGDGDYKKRKSTGRQIGLGVLQGLGNSAGLLAGTYFQGRQVSDNIPYQEQYIYNQMDQQYAYNWYQQNATPFTYPGYNNPYFLPQLGGYSGGYSFGTP